MLDKYNATQLLHVMVESSLKHIRDEKSIPEAIEKNLESCSRYLKTMVSLKDQGTARKIGVFGPRKRGKSKLLNALLGVDILPVDVTPMTRTVVEIKQDGNVENWEVIISNRDGTILYPDKLTSPEQVCKKIKQVGTRQATSELAEIIEVKSAFPDCKILEKGGILVDTPGAEASFGEVENEKGEISKKSKSDEALKEDTERALDILNNVHVVIFCARADCIGSGSEATFFKEYLAHLRPLNVVTFLDKWEDKDPLLEHAVKTYGFPFDRTLCVSAKWAEEAKKEKDDNKLKKSNIKELESRIIKEIEEFEPERGIITTLKHYVKILDKFSVENIYLLPDKIYVENFQNCLKEIDEQWAKDVLEVLYKGVILKMQ